MALFNWWPAIVLGWPSALVGGALLVAGGLSGKSWLAGLGALISVGFCLYVSMNPMPFRFSGIVALACNAGFAFAVRRGTHPAAFLWLVPFLALAGFAAQVAFSDGGTPSNNSLKRTSGLAATCRLAQVR